MKKTVTIPSYSQKEVVIDTKILHLRTELARNKSRVVVIDDSSIDDSSTASVHPYDVIAIGAKTTHALVQSGAPVVAAYWPTSNDSDWISAKDYKFMIASPNADRKYKNALNMNHFYENYPHLGEWEGSANDAVNKIVKLLQYETIVSAHSSRPRFHVLLQLWRPKSKYRWRELCAAIRKNAENPLIDKVHVLLEERSVAECWLAWPEELKAKIVATDHSKRLTYRDARDYMAALPEEDYAALINTDIYFDESVRHLWSIDMSGKCLALLRYDVALDYVEGKEGSAEPKLFGPRVDSQDSWIFRVADLKKADNWRELTFTLGLPGCDNAFAGELVRRKWTVANPCMSIKTIHIHESGFRTYRKEEQVSLGIYATIMPTGLSESLHLEASKFETAATIKTRILETFSVEPWAGSARTHSAYQRGLTALYKAVQPTQIGSELKWQDCTLKVLKSGEGSIITEDGLIVRGNGIGFSDDRTASDLAWAETGYHSLTPLIKVDTGLFIPSISSYVGDEIIQLGRALWIKRVVALEKPTFTCIAPQLMPNLQDQLTFRDVHWKAAICNEAYGFLPSFNLKYAVEPVIERLRETISVKSRDEPGWVVFGCDADLVDSLAEITNETIIFTNIVNPNISSSRIIHDMTSAKVVVGNSAAIGYMWAAPIGAIYIDLEPSKASLNMANVCGLKYIPLGFEDGVLTEDKARILLDAGDWRSSEDSLADRPTLYMPSAREGYHGHPGDSFRELAELWAEAGYVKRQYHDGVFCWLGGVGDKLLYDRDTNEWLNKAPEAEMKWTDAVFANEVGDKKPWIYWARRPRLLMGREPLAERKRGLVFYGKIENSIQFKRRAAKATGKDWSTVCDEFEMPVGGKYKYTQAEYLDRLAEARYGLSLPGFGPKCHREIECMALGVVPVVTPGIDVDGYAEPLIKGIHYLFAETPEEAKRLVAETTDEIWTSMSSAGRAWYERNCSVAGSWAITCNQLGISLE